MASMSVSASATRGPAAAKSLARAAARRFRPGFSRRECLPWLPSTRPRQRSWRKSLRSSTAPRGLAPVAPAIGIFCKISISIFSDRLLLTSRTAPVFQRTAVSQLTQGGTGSRRRRKNSGTGRLGSSRPSSECCWRATTQASLFRPDVALAGLVQVQQTPRVHMLVCPVSGY